MLSIFNFYNNRQMFIINTYTVKHTLYRGLNRLQMYVREIKEKQIFKRIRWQLRIFESVFYKSLIRACSIGNSRRCEPKCPQRRSDIQPQALRICKKRTQKVLMFATLILLNICFSFISLTYI